MYRAVAVLGRDGELRPDPLGNTRGFQNRDQPQLAGRYGPSDRRALYGRFGDACLCRAAQTTNSLPPTTVAHEPAAPPIQTNQTQPTSGIPVTQANNATSSPSDQGIVVTGSRIRRPNLEVGRPGHLDPGRAVLPARPDRASATRSTTCRSCAAPSPSRTRASASASPASTCSTFAVSAPKRTLVLVNGRRHVAADILNSAVSPDINTIPNDLIDRVDIVTGGNSAVYGSDAIAGVVNFILKRDFDGAPGARAGRRKPEADSAPTISPRRCGVRISTAARATSPSRRICPSGSRVRVRHSVAPSERHVPGR